MPKIKHYVLGKDASTFWDASTRTKITSRTNPTPYQNENGQPKPLSKRMQLALKAGHIVEVDAPAKVEVVEDTKGDGAEKTLEEMNDKELTAYYKDNYQTKPADLKAFKDLSTEEKIKFLKESEAEEE